MFEFEDVNWKVVIQTAILVPLLFCLIWYVLVPLLEDLFTMFMVNEEQPEDEIFLNDTHVLRGCKPCERSSRSIQMNGNPSVRVKACDRHVESHRRQRLVSRIERQNTIIH